MASLKDKVVLITGAGDETGIGAATAMHMIQFQPKLVLTGRNLKKLERVGNLIEEAGLSRDRLLLVVADVTVDKDLEILVEKTIHKFEQLDVLVNNAAITAYNQTVDTSMEEFDRIMRTNTRAPFFLSKLCIPHVIKTKGNVVNVSSICGQMSFTGEAAYGISKAGLDHFTRILAMEVAKYGVRVNSVNYQQYGAWSDYTDMQADLASYCPGVIRTNIQRKGGMSPERYAEYAERQKSTHPLGDMGEPVDVAKAITFLASDDSSFITGEILFIDGGRHTLPV